MEIYRFPNKLKMFRRCQGYSQKKVARLLGFADTSTLSRWERGYSLPSLMQVFRLARIYHAEPQELFEHLWKHVDCEKNLLAQVEEPYTTNQSFLI
jgi:transcriptional regulator with XRE-family HTH domain